MNNIYKDVVIYKGKVGKLIEKIHNGNKVYRFYPAGYGSYYEEELEMVTNPEEDVVIAGSARGKEYAIKEFEKHGIVKEYLAISDKYQIVVDAKNGHYIPHIKYESISRGFKDLKSALIGMIVYDSVGTEDIHLNKYIFKLLDMEW